MKAFDLTSETALITGGGSGIGLGMAKCLIQCGAKVIITGRREDVLQEAVNELGPQASYTVKDVTELESNEQFAEQVEKDHGPISILINNAGIHLKKSAEEVTDTEFQSVMQTHVNAAFSLSREFGKKMLQRKKGHILFTASMASYMGIPKVIAYSAAKTAHLGMVRAFASEFSPHGVRVNAIAPGWINSDMTEKVMNGDPARKNKILSRTPMNKFGEADDIGWAAAYLSSPAAKFITGVCLPVDGGVSIGF